MKFKSLVLAAALLALALPASAATWKVDPSHSSVGFKVKHLVITNVRGQFGEFSATATTKGDDLSTLAIDATIQIASVDTNNDKRDEHLRSADFFDAEKFPAMTFKSKRTEVAGEGRLKIVGDLTIKDVTKEVTLDVEGPTPAITDPWGNTKVGVSATTTIDRTAFGMTWSKTLEAGGLVVGNDIGITLDLEVAKLPDAPPEPTPAAAPAK